MAKPETETTKPETPTAGAQQQPGADQAGQQPEAAAPKKIIPEAFQKAAKKFGIGADQVFAVSKDGNTVVTIDGKKLKATE